MFKSVVVNFGLVEFLVCRLILSLLNVVALRSIYVLVFFVWFEVLPILVNFLKIFGTGLEKLLQSRLKPGKIFVQNHVGVLQQVLFICFVFLRLWMIGRVFFQAQGLKSDRISEKLAALVCGIVSVPVARNVCVVV